VYRPIYLCQRSLSVIFRSCVFAQSPQFIGLVYSMTHNDIYACICIVVVVHFVSSVDFARSHVVFWADRGQEQVGFFDVRSTVVLLHGRIGRHRTRHDKPKRASWKLVTCRLFSAEDSHSATVREYIASCRCISLRIKGYFVSNWNTLLILWIKINRISLETTRCQCNQGQIQGVTGVTLVNFLRERE